MMLRKHVACICLPLFTLGRMQDGIARSCDWISLALTPAYIIRSVLLIGGMAAAYLLRLPTDASTAMLVAVATTWATVIGQTLVMNRRLKHKVTPGPKAYLPRTWLAVSVPIFMVEGFYMLLTYADIIVLQQYRSPDEVAVYYAAAKTLALVAFVYFSVSAATAHKFSEYHVAGDKAEAVFDNAVAAFRAWLIAARVPDTNIHRLSASPRDGPALLRLVLVLRGRLVRDHRWLDRFLSGPVLVVVFVVATATTHDRWLPRGAAAT